MELPWLRKGKISGSIVQTKVRPSDYRDGENPNKSDESEDDAGLLSASKDLLTAIQAGDEKGIAQAIKAAFEICDSSPHSEGPHINDEQETE